MHPDGGGPERLNLACGRADMEDVNDCDCRVGTLNNRALREIASALAAIEVLLDRRVRVN